MNLVSGAVGNTFSISADKPMTKGDGRSYRIDRWSDLHIKIKTGLSFKIKGEDLGPTAVRLSNESEVRA
ncbi:MAG: hypothetical protein QOE96_4252 [Blastocatellia bacterium]|nr:hypothetical protein [Blastocatellia bacterium]